MCFKTLSCYPWCYQDSGFKQKTANKTAFFIGIFSYGSIPDKLKLLWKKIPLNDTIEVAIKGLRQYRYAYQLTMFAVICSLIVQLLIFLSAFFIAKAVGIDVTFFQIVIIVTIVTCIISLPISIGGHGVREGGFLLMFSMFSSLGTQTDEPFQEIVILFSLLYLSLNLFWGIFGGVVYLFYRHSDEHLLQSVSEDLKFRKQQN